MQPKITIVVAMNQNNVIGVNNQLPWYIPEDLKHFKQITMGKPIIMGRKTFESIGRVLPGRDNVVITRDINWSYPEVITYNSLFKAIEAYHEYEEICIIGGGQIFEQALPIAHELHVTIIDYVVDNPTTFFPNIDITEWILISQSEIQTENGIKCQFKHYQKNSY